MDKYLIETERLGLRLITKDDVDSLHKMYSDPKTMKFMMKMLDRKGTLEWLDWHFEHYKINGFGLWAVEIKKNKTFIGRVGLLSSMIENKKEVEMGWSIYSKHWNNGYATEAALACRNYAFNMLKVKALYATLYLENIASVRIAEKIGMTYYGEITYKGTEDTPLYFLKNQ